MPRPYRAPTVREGIPRIKPAQTTTFKGARQLVTTDDSAIRLRQLTATQTSEFQRNKTLFLRTRLAGRKIEVTYSLGKE